MNKWVRMKVGEISESCLGKMLDKDKNKGEFQPYLSNKSVRWGAFDLDNLSLMRFEKDEDERYGLNVGDLVVCEGGEPGRCAIWNGQISQMKIQKALHRVRIKPNYSNQFLYYQFLLAGKNGDLDKYFIGSTIKHLTGVNLKQIEFNFPSLQIQNSIANVLSCLDAKIELNNRINAELEAMAKTVYDYWFVQFDFPNEEGKPYRTEGGKMVWSDALKREIPEGWEVKSLFDAMEVQYGFPFDTTKFTNEITNTPVIRIRDILENTISTYTTEVVDDKYKLKEKDLLIGMDGNFHMNFWDKNGAYLNQRNVRIRSKNDSEVSNFQAYFELSPYIKAREKNVSRTTVGHLSDKDLKRLFIIIPIKIGNFAPKVFFDGLLKKIILNRLENQQLTQLRDWLLPMLMNGQVTVLPTE